MGSLGQHAVATSVGSDLRYVDTVVRALEPYGEALALSSPLCGRSARNDNRTHCSEIDLLGNVCVHVSTPGSRLIVDSYMPQGMQSETDPELATSLPWHVHGSAISALFVCLYMCI